MATKTVPADTAELEDGRRPDIEAELDDKYHVKWSYVPQVPIAKFDLNKSQHNQARFEPIDPHTVEQYADAVKRGDKFPPVIAWRPTPRGRLVIIDGNHRLSAHTRAETPVDVYEVDRDTDPRTVALMTFSFNTKHGRPTSEAERLSQAVYLVDNGASIDHAAAAVNLPSKALKKALARNAADRRADEVGLRRNEWDTLTSTVKNRLKDIATDEGFEDAARLAYDARLGAEEVFELVATLNATKSGKRQSAIIHKYRELHAERIQAGGVLKTGGRKAPSPKGRLNMMLGQVLALPEDDSIIVNSYAAPERANAAKSLRETGDRMLRLAGKLEGK